MEPTIDRLARKALGKSSLGISVRSRCIPTYYKTSRPLTQEHRPKLACNHLHRRRPRIGKDHASSCGVLADQRDLPSKPRDPDPDPDRRRHPHGRLPPPARPPSGAAQRRRGPPSPRRRLHLRRRRVPRARPVAAGRGPRRRGRVRAVLRPRDQGPGTAVDPDPRARARRAGGGQLLRAGPAAVARRGRARGHAVVRRRGGRGGARAAGEAASGERHRGGRERGVGAGDGDG